MRNKIDKNKRERNEVNKKKKVFPSKRRKKKKWEIKGNSDTLFFWGKV